MLHQLRSHPKSETYNLPHVAVLTLSEVAFSWGVAIKSDIWWPFKNTFKSEVSWHGCLSFWRKKIFDYLDHQNSFPHNGLIMDGLVIWLCKYGRKSFIGRTWITTQKSLNLKIQTVNHMETNKASICHQRRRLHDPREISFWSWLLLKVHEEIMHSLKGKIETRRLNSFLLSLELLTNLIM